ncbi:MAG: hypothetical protein ACRED5_03710 [Propylenella sp.]
MTVELEEIGRTLDREPIVLWPRDNDGALSNLGESCPMQAKYKEVCEKAVARIINAHGPKIDCVYVRGSVAIAAAVPPYSDLDLLAAGSLLPRDAPDICSHLESEHPFLESVDLVLVDTLELKTSSDLAKLRAMISTQSKLLSGTDIRPELGRYHPDRVFAKAHFGDLARECNWLAEILSGAIPSPSFRGVDRGRQFWVRWSMRNVLRASQLLAMLCTAEYSSHLGTCTRLAAKHFPQFRRQLLKAFWIERQHSPDPEAAHVVLADFQSRVLPLWDRSMN